MRFCLLKAYRLLFQIIERHTDYALQLIELHTDYPFSLLKGIYFPEHLPAKTEMKSNFCKIGLMRLGGEI